MRLLALLLALAAAVAAASAGDAAAAGAGDDDGCGGGSADGGFPLRLLSTRGSAGSPEVFVCPAAVAYLRDVVGERAVAIASVVGNARIGKSFLTNHLLGRPQAGPDSFVVGHGPSGVTKGAWLAPAPDEPAPAAGGNGSDAAAAAGGNGSDAAAAAEGAATAPPPAASLAPLQLLLDVEGFSDGEARDADLDAGAGVVAFRKLVGHGEDHVLGEVLASL